MDQPTNRIHRFINFCRINAQMATARDQHNRSHIFLIHPTGEVYQRESIQGDWEQLNAEESYRVSCRVSLLGSYSC